MKGEELRHIIGCMVGKVGDSEFGELMQTLDPGGTGLVDVRALTRLLEGSPHVSFRGSPAFASLCGRKLSQERKRCR